MGIVYYVALHYQYVLVELYVNTLAVTTHELYVYENEINNGIFATVLQCSISCLTDKVAAKHMWLLNIGQLNTGLGIGKLAA